MKRAVIIGASSGIGRAMAQMLIQDGWYLGIAGRRTELLDDLCRMAPERVIAMQIDVTANDCEERLNTLISRLGGMYLYLHVAGVGWKNPSLDREKEQATFMTNAVGFAQMTGAAFRYFAAHTGGHIAIVSSIAGTKGIGVAASYSATKAMQSTYLQALEQLATGKKLNITFTDIRPGFVDTGFLDEEGKRNGAYPMLMPVGKVARIAVDSIYKKKRIVVIDIKWRIVTFIWRLFPSFLWRRIKL